MGCFIEDLTGEVYSFMDLDRSFLKHLEPTIFLTLDCALGGDGEDLFHGPQDAEKNWKALVANSKGRIPA